MSDRFGRMDAVVAERLKAAAMPKRCTHCAETEQIQLVSYGPNIVPTFRCRLCRTVFNAEQMEAAR